MAQKYQKSNAGETQIYDFGGLRVKKVELKIEALTGGVRQGPFNNFKKFTVKHLR